MNQQLMGMVKPFETKVVADKSTIRNFVKDMAEITEKISDCKSDLKEAIDSNEEVTKLKEEIKKLKEEITDIIETNPVIMGYAEKLNDVLEERKQLISDGKQNGVPKAEIDVAIKMLKKDISPDLAGEVYSTIADLVDI